MRKFERLLEEKAKKGKKMSDSERQAKMDAVKDIDGMASKMMGDKLAGLKKVTVASPDKKGLEKGLDVAKELLSADESDGSEDKSSEEDAQEITDSEQSIDNSEHNAERSEEDDDHALEESKADRIKRLEEELDYLKKMRE